MHSSIITTALCWLYLLLVTSASNSPGDVLSHRGKDYVIEDMTALCVSNRTHDTSYAVSFRAVADPDSVEVTFFNLDPSVSNDTFTRMSFKSHLAFINKAKALAGNATAKDWFLASVSYTYNWHLVFSWRSWANGVSSLANALTLALTRTHRSPRAVCTRHRDGKRDEPCVRWNVFWPISLEQEPAGSVAEMCYQVCRAQGMVCDVALSAFDSMDYFCVTEEQYRRTH